MAVDTIVNALFAEQVPTKKISVFALFHAHGADKFTIRFLELINLRLELINLRLHGSLIRLNGTKCSNNIDWLMGPTYTLVCLINNGQVRVRLASKSDATDCLEERVDSFIRIMPCRWFQARVGVDWLQRIAHGLVDVWSCFMLFLKCCVLFVFVLFLRCLCHAGLMSFSCRITVTLRYL